MSRRSIPLAVSCVIVVAVLSLVCSPSYVYGAASLTAARIDLSGTMMQEQEFVQAELYPKQHSGSYSLIEDWSNYIMSVSGLLAVKQHLGDPNEHPHFLAPDQRSTPSYGGYGTQTEYDYEWQRIGKVLPNDLTPFTEGYRPPLHGYFQQSAECDQFFRMWADQCAFKDESDNVYHKGPKNFFKDGDDTDRKSSATYLKEVMDKWEQNSHMFKSAERFGGTPKSDDEEAPTEFDTQKAPPN